MKKCFWLVAFAVIWASQAVAVDTGDSLAMDMVEIPGGAFVMGNTGKANGESRQHKQVLEVVVPGFSLGRYEVTFAQWDLCYQEGGCTRNPEDKDWGRGLHPVMNISWMDVQEFIAWLNAKTGKSYRLPSEVEWEYAAKGGTTTLWHWGDEVGEGNANCAGCEKKDQQRDQSRGWSTGQTAPVGSYPANPLGLHDMLGNLMEYTQDCWRNGLTQEDRPKDGAAYIYDHCDRRVLKGGAWFTRPFMTTSSARNAAYSSKNYRTSYYGFRLAHDALPKALPVYSTSPVVNFTGFSPVYFDVDESVIRQDQLLKLESVVAYLSKNKGHRISITGYADSTHTFEYNQLLSERRARVVVDWLAEQGLKNSIGEIRFMGSLNPVESNSSDYGRSLNRRVVIRLEKSSL